MPRLVQRRGSLQLVVIGDGPERRAIEDAAAAAGIADRLVWLGAADDDAKAHWMAHAAVCIMPNVVVPGDIEGFGIVALEAAAAGCPVVASDIEGLRDAIAHGESGNLVQPGDAPSWLAAIDGLLADAATNGRSGERARSHVRAHRRWEPIVDAYDRALTSVAREPSGPAR
jgi:glycosyltransferase involved in cell wall biosynthesis